MSGYERILADELRGVIGSQQQSAVEALKEALGNQEQHVTPSLNDARLLTALGSVDSNHSTKEAVARLLYEHRKQTEYMNE